MLDFVSKLKARQTRGANVSFQVADGAIDPDAVVDLVKAAHAETRLSYIPFSPTKTRKLLAEIISEPKSKALLIARDGDRLIGIAYVTLGEYFLGEGMLICSVHTLYVRKDKRKGLNGGVVALGLLKGIESWAQARNASEIMLYDTSGINPRGFQKFLGRMGFKVIGGSYARSL